MTETNGQIATSIARNTTVMMASQFVTGLSSFVLILFLPRYLGSEEYGRLYLAISVVTIFQIVMEFGGSFFIAKEISRDREGAADLVANSVVLRAMLWVGSIAALMVIAFAIGYSHEVKMLILILAISKLWEVSEKVLISCFQGFEAMQYSSSCNIVERVFMTIAGVTALLLGAGAITIAMVMATSTLLSFFVSLRFGKRLITFTRQYKWPRVKSLLRLGLPYFLYSIFGVIYYRVDAVMLSLWSPEAVLGWYGAAYRFFDVVMFLPSIFTIAVFPVLSRLWGKEQATLARTTQKSLEFMLLAGLPLSLMIFSFSRQIIEIFFSFEKYAPSVILLEIFAVGLLLVYLDMMLGTALFASDKQRQWSWVAFFAIFVNIGLNTLLIPYFQFHSGNGGIGSAIATLITELFVMCGALALLPGDLFRGKTIAVQLKGLAAGALMGLTLFFLHMSGLPWLVQALLGFIVYMVALALFRVLDHNEQRFLRNFLSLRSLRSTFVLQKQQQA